LKSINGFGGVTGQRNRYALMTNVLYDFPLGWIVSPHIGAGIGLVNQHDAISLQPGIVATFPGTTYPCAASCTLASSNNWTFGYQGIAGVRYNINPALAFDLDYRYLGTSDPTFKSSFGTKFTSEHSSHNVVASLSMRFGAPAIVVAPPAPPPPPVTRRVFLVF